MQSAIAMGSLLLLLLCIMGFVACCVMLCTECQRHVTSYALAKTIKCIDSSETKLVIVLVLANGSDGDACSACCSSNGTAPAAVKAASSRVACMHGLSKGAGT